MRTLEFNVEKQRLKRVPTCDYSGLVAGSVGYLRVKFNFSPEWDGCKKAARFTLKDGSQPSEYGELLDTDNSCVVTADILRSPEFYVSVKGCKWDGKYQIESSELRIKQEVRN